MPSPARRAAWSIAALALASGGCITLHGGIGPTQSSAGSTGMLATAGLAVGYSFPGHQGVYISPNGGVLYDRHARAVLFDSIDYQNFGGPWPFRVGVRFGPVFGRDRYGLPDRTMVGGAMTWFPFAHRLGGGGSDYHSEKGWTDFDLFPRLATWRAVGVEVAVDAHLPDTGSPERTAVLVTVSVVGELITMRDR
ncbi:MAG: hypothetical protein K8W52_13885 [Deltaproteobacteria bacterium]|nr:hypothetical protein [Deltaproteobacteria bacterium]